MPQIAFRCKCLPTIYSSVFNHTLYKNKKERQINIIDEDIKKLIRVQIRYLPVYLHRFLLSLSLVSCEFLSKCCIHAHYSLGKCFNNNVLTELRILKLISQFKKGIH